MRRVRKLIASLLVLCMVVTVIPVNVNAQQPGEGDNQELLTDVIAASAEEVEELLEDGETESSTADASDEAAAEAGGETAAEEAEPTEESGESEVSADEATNSELDERNVIQNDETGIPDEAFYQAVLKELDKAEDEKFTYDEAKDVTSLDLSGSGVKDFTGIGNLSNLEYLDASDNELTELEGVVTLWNLETLILNNNKLGSFDALTDIYTGGLVRLEAADNELTDINGISYSYNLRVLDVSHNKITDISDVYVPYLVEFNASYNEIVSLEDFYLSWDIVKLDVSHNKISALRNLNSYWDVFSPDFVDEKPLIDFSYNKLTKLEMILKLPEELHEDEPWLTYNLQGQEPEEQNIIRNDETGIPDQALYAAILEEGDIDKNGVLTEDEAEYITYLYVGWSSTTSQYYTVKDLTGIGYLKNLRTLRINDLEATDLTPLTELDNLEYLYIWGDGIENLDVIKNLKVYSLSIGTNNSKGLSLAGLEEMTELVDLTATISAEELEYIAKVPNLEYLNLSFWMDNALPEDIDLSLLTQTETLRELYIYGTSYYDWGYDEENGYWDIQVNSKVTSLDYLKEFTNLESVTISDVELESDEELAVFNELPKLRYLTFTYSGIEDLSALTSLPNIRNLYLYGNEIEDISPLSFLTESERLYNLNLAHNKIKDISSMTYLGELTRLDSLQLYDNEIEDISVLKVLSGCEKLWQLNLSSNNISDISALESLSGLQNFYWLNLSSNKIKDLTPLAALADCPNLRELNISWNELTDLTGIEGLVSLRELNVSYNELKTLPDLTALINLDPEWTYFHGNRLTADELKDKMPTHLADNQTWINDNRYDEYEWWEEVVDEYDPEKIVDLLEDETVSNVKVILDPEEMSEVDSDVFKAAAKNGKEISFDVVDDSGNTVYQWSFDGYHIDNPDMDLDLTINFETEVQAEIEELTGRTDAMYLSFAHHGELPGPALMTVYVGNQYEDGEIIYLYYYNDETGEIELMAGGLYVNDGYVTFTITHCSDYFLLDEMLEEEDGGEEPGVTEPEEPGTEEPEEPGTEEPGTEEPEEPGTEEPEEPGVTEPEEPGTEEPEEPGVTEPEEPGTEEPEEPGVTEPEEPGTEEPGVTEEQEEYVTGLSDEINVSEVISALRNDKYSSVNILLTAPDVVAAEIFQVLKETGKAVSFIIIQDEKAAYQWTFDGKNLNHAETEVDLALAFESAKKTEIDKLTGDQEAVYLSFAHDGELPGRAEVTVYVGDTFEDGEVLYLYYYNEETGELELITANGLLTGGGYVTFTLDHCSEYVLVSEKVKTQAEVTDTVNGSENDTKTTTKTETPAKTDSPATGDSNSVLFLLFMLMAAATVTVYTGKRKKQML